MVVVCCSLIGGSSVWCFVGFADELVFLRFQSQLQVFYKLPTTSIVQMDTIFTEECFTYRSVFQLENGVIVYECDTLLSKCFAGSNL